ncbi:MAG: twin-arginine translocation signal domain-containing protein [bacterium]
MKDVHPKSSQSKEKATVSGQSRRSFMKKSAGMAAAVGLIGPSKTLADGSKPVENTSGVKIAMSPLRQKTFAIVSSPGSGQKWISDDWNPRSPFVIWGKPLRVQPVLMYATPQPREQTSWRSWGGVLSEETAQEEVERISGELESLSKTAEFPVEILPVQKVKSPEEAAQAIKSDNDVVVVYPASGSGRTLRASVPPEGNAIIFVRHRSGPVYYWYEALSVQYLDTGEEEPRGGNPPGLGKTHVEDVVVDDYDEVLWRLRALYGVKNFIGAKIIALGGPMGKYAGDAPQIARDKYKLDIIEIPYSDIEKRITSAFADKARISKAEQWTETYLSLPNTTLKTDRPFVVNAFLLYDIFKDYMRENQTAAFTIRDCMSTIIPMSKTTACLSLGLLNDEGLLAFCESDFVIIPAGILLRHISGTPVFLHNSTFPHKAVVTCAHCSAPRRMDGDNYEPTTILTHEESDYGAAPKVDIPIGQEVTFIDPEYTVGRWVGIRGNVVDNPFLPICRSQQDVQIQGNWKKLLSEARDSHWMMTYGNYLQEVGYAARKLGIVWENISDV